MTHATGWAEPGEAAADDDSGSERPAWAPRFLIVIGGPRARFCRCGS